MKKINLFVLFLLLSITLSACSQNQKTPTSSTKVPVDNNQKINQKIVSLSEKLDKQSKIKKFSDYDELQEFLENNDEKDTYRSYTKGLVRNEVMFDSLESGFSDLAMPTMQNKMKEESVGITNADDGGSNSGSDDFSKTNVQIKGVDEADIIKTDGKYIYAVSNKNLFIIDAYPAESSEILAKIEFKSRPQNIYINGDSLVIFGYDQTFWQRDDFKHFKRRNSYTFFKVFDISDPKNPKQTRDLDIEGSYTDSRMIGDYVYFVTTNYNHYYIENEPILPRIIDGDEVLANKCENNNKCFMPEVYYFDMPYESHNFVSINAINIVNNNEKLAGDVYLMSSGQNMFVSTNNIYITYTKYISEYELEIEIMKELIYPLLSEKDQDKIAKIEAVDSFILSKNEKRNKIMQIIERYGESLSDDEQERLEKELESKMKQKYTDISKELEKTIIHKIGINKNKLEYKASGEVVGDVLNQFSMNESKGYFQIATTKGRTWSRYMDDEEKKSYNNLYVLDSDLKQVGALEGLARDEKIYSVRFMQDRAYMVTFKQMDPLFVIDLADPKNPKVLGELKIPGYSNYLHPYDENTLIGIGKDTQENEWGGVRTKGVKLSLFDVSNVSEPKEIDTYVLGDSGSDSIALHDHKAFLFSKDKNLLVIPVSLREYFDEKSMSTSLSRRTSFRGAAVFDVSKKGFDLKGKLNHYSVGDSESRYDYYYDSSVKRSLYIDNVLYTFSDKYLMMNDLENLNEIDKKELKKERKNGDSDFDVIN